MAPISLIRVSDLIKGFANFLAASGVEKADAIQHAQAAAFVRSLTRSGNEPSLATMHLRRSALRILFREAKALGVLSIDPTHDIALPPRSYRALRPLTDEEVERCRSFATGAIGEPRDAVAWALAEATARVSELGAIRASDVDLERHRVWVAGSSSTEARWAKLTAWGLEHLGHYLTSKPTPTAERPLLSSGKAGGRSFLHELVSSTLRRAGLAEKPGVRPNSAPAWRGAKALAEGASIDEVALLLGMRSLDRAASFIGFEWQGER
jgi:integrase/recombinase XerC